MSRRRERIKRKRRKKGRRDSRERAEARIRDDAVGRDSEQWKRTADIPEAYQLAAISIPFTVAFAVPGVTGLPQSVRLASFCVAFLAGLVLLRASRSRENRRWALVWTIGLTA